MRSRRRRPRVRGLAGERGRGVYGARREVVGRGGARHRDIARDQRHERRQRSLEHRDFARAQGSELLIIDHHARRNSSAAKAEARRSGAYITGRPTFGWY